MDNTSFLYKPGNVQRSLGVPYYTTDPCLHSKGRSTTIEKVDGEFPSAEAMYAVTTARYADVISKVAAWHTNAQWQRPGRISINEPTIQTINSSEFLKETLS